MFDSSTSLLPTIKSPPLKAVTLGLNESDPSEISGLLGTLGVEVLAQRQAAVRKIQPATYFGSGKLEEVKVQMESLGAQALVVDLDLSANQLKNIEKKVAVPVLDRSGVILEIFSQHARTKEAKTQVELAKLQYLMPRLTHFWTHFERQRGGVGLRGMGEKQLEVDRRLLKKRIALLKKRLQAIEKERQVQRSGRRDVLKVALVGYTNAGKSTLLNGLTHSQVRAEDKLFATLDSSVRSLDPHSQPPVVAIDTVGFISQIPTFLIASFRSTLEELQTADLLVHVLDASSRFVRKQLEVTEKILIDLNLKDKPRLVVLNKSDQVDSREINWVKILAPGAELVSALSAKDLERVRERILEYFRKGLEVFEIVVPYSERGRVEAQLHSYGRIEKKKDLQEGTFYRIRMDSAWAARLDIKRYQI